MDNFYDAWDFIVPSIMMSIFSFLLLLLLVQRPSFRMTKKVAMLTPAVFVLLSLAMSLFVFDASFGRLCNNWPWVIGGNLIVWLSGYLISRVFSVVCPHCGEWNNYVIVNVSNSRYSRLDTVQKKVYNSRGQDTGYYVEDEVEVYGTRTFFECKCAKCKKRFTRSSRQDD